MEKKNSATTWKKKGMQPLRAPVRRKWEKQALPHARKGGGQQLREPHHSAAFGGGAVALVEGAPTLEPLSTGGGAVALVEGASALERRNTAR